MRRSEFLDCFREMMSSFQQNQEKLIASNQELIRSFSRSVQEVTSSTATSSLAPQGSLTSWGLTSLGTQTDSGGLQLAHQLNLLKMF